MAHKMYVGGSEGSSPERVSGEPHTPQNTTTSSGSCNVNTPPQKAQRLEAETAFPAAPATIGQGSARVNLVSDEEVDISSSSSRLVSVSSTSSRELAQRKRQLARKQAIHETKVQADKAMALKAEAEANLKRAELEAEEEELQEQIDALLVQKFRGNWAREESVCRILPYCPKPREVKRDSRCFPRQPCHGSRQSGGTGGKYVPKRVCS